MRNVGEEKGVGCSKVDEKRQALLRELEKLLRARGGQLYASQRALDDIWSVVRGNADEIIRFEQLVNSSPEHRLNLNIDTYSLVLTDLARRFHSFLAAAVTVDDYALKHVTSFYRGKQLSRDLQSRRMRLFADEPACSIIYALRNAALHYTLPELRLNFWVMGPPGGHINDPGRFEKVTLVLDGMHALVLIRAMGNKRNPIHQHALKFLSAAAKDIGVTKMLNEYMSAMKSLHHWLGRAEEEKEGTLIEEFASPYNRIVNDLNST